MFFACNSSVTNILAENHTAVCSTSTGMHPHTPVVENQLRVSLPSWGSKTSGGDGTGGTCYGSDWGNSPLVSQRGRPIPVRRPRVVMNIPFTLRSGGPKGYWPAGLKGIFGRRSGKHLWSLGPLSVECLSTQLLLEQTTRGLHVSVRVDKGWGGGSE